MRAIRSLPVAGLILFTAACSSVQTVTILHFSDYHSHAVPFYTDGQRESAGIARAFAFIEPLASGDDVLVFNGGDTMNRGAPAWSDRFHCIEWSWWNGIVDAMAFGNHDSDYGSEVFEQCRTEIDYPILGANVTGPDGKPLFEDGGKRYAIFERNGIRIGAFALAGSDFEALIGDENAPSPGVAFLDRNETAREIIGALRDQEHVQAVVLIGHGSTEDDEALAREVPGIDLILGTHSHRLEPLRTIDETGTRIISPGQYLTHVSRVELNFADGELIGIAGRLVPMTRERPEDPQIAALVASHQSVLESDPSYAGLFQIVGSLDRALPNDEVNQRTTPLGAWVLDLVRNAASAEVALSTSSSFRGSLPDGPIRETDLLAVLPYDNRVARISIGGTELEVLLDRVASLRGSDSFAQISGADLGNGTPHLVGGKPIEPDATYVVATTDYMANVATRYRDIFDSVEIEITELRVRELVRSEIGRSVPTKKTGQRDRQRRNSDS